MSLKFKRDAAERVAATAVEAILGVVTAESIMEILSIDDGTVKAVAYASLTSLFAALKTRLARRRFDADSAAWNK